MKRTVWFIVLLLVADSATRAGAEVISQITSPACRIADVKVEGATEFTTNRVVELSRLQSGQMAGELPIARATERVRRAYANRGRIKASVSIESDIKSPQIANSGQLTFGSRSMRARCSICAGSSSSVITRPETG